MPLPARGVACGAADVGAATTIRSYPNWRHRATRESIILLPPKASMRGAIDLGEAIAVTRHDEVVKSPLTVRFAFADSGYGLILRWKSKSAAASPRSPWFWRK